VPLSESIGIQSVVLTIERRTNRLSVSDWRSALRSLGREGGIAALVAVACAALVGVVAVAWQRDARLRGGRLGPTLVSPLLSPCTLHVGQGTPTETR
jgi:hypothetical protein